MLQVEPSPNMLLVLFTTCFLLWMIHYWLSLRKLLNLPSPGICLPVFGHFHLFLNASARQDPVGTLSKMWKTHQKDGVLWVRRFAADMLLVGDLKVAKQLYNHPDMQGRSVHNSAMKNQFLENRDTPGNQVQGVLFSDGPIWAEQRRFTLRTLRDFGFGKAKMEELINEEVEVFNEVLKSYRGEPIDMAGKLNLPILNALWKITVGQRFDYDDPQLTRIITQLTEFFQRVGATPQQLIALSFPRMAKLLGWIAPNVLERGKTIAINQEIMALMHATVRDHEETIDANAPRDFTDSVLLEVLRTTDPSSSFYGDWGRTNLANTLVDLFIAGNFYCVFYLLFMYPQGRRQPPQPLRGLYSTWHATLTCKREYKRSWTRWWVWGEEHSCQIAMLFLSRVPLFWRFNAMPVFCLLECRMSATLTFLWVTSPSHRAPGLGSSCPSY